MRFYWERVEATRNFANKIWNASRFALMNMEGYDAEAKQAPYTLADQWILSRLQHTVKDVTELLGRFELGEAGRLIYDFIWSEVYGTACPGRGADIGYEVTASVHAVYH